MAPPFGRFAGPGLPSTIPPSGAPFTLSTGTTLHPTVAFSADAYGASGVPDRPKKVSMLQRLMLGLIYHIWHQTSFCSYFPGFCP